METIYTTTSATPKVLVTHNPKSREILNYEQVTTDHNGTLIDDSFFNTEKYGIYIKDEYLDETYYKAVFHDNVINLNHFINRNDINGTPNITALVRYAIEIAYQLSENHIGFREPLKIKIPSGRFIVDNTLIDSSLGVNGGRFTIEGEAYQNTIIFFEPDSDLVMFDNYDIFGFSTFSNITFISEKEGKTFMSTNVTDRGNAQSLIFNSCYFKNFKTILDVSGNTMMSEITFRDCKIKNSRENSLLFKLNNPQAVNWRFYGTDIEAISGTIFDFYAGLTISYFQGSIISNDITENVIINVNSLANPDLFGQGNKPNLQMYGVRFELRNNTQLIKINHNDVEFSAKFDNCGMGGYNLNPSTFAMDLKGKGQFIFDNCSNFENFRFRHEITNSSSYLSPAKIKFINTCPDLDLINNGVCNEVTNTGGYPIYTFENCGLNSYYRPFGRDTFFLNNDYYKISKKIISKGHRNNRTETTGIVQDRVYVDLGPNTTGYKELVSFDIPDVPIHSIKIIFDKAWPGGYGGLIYNVKVYNTDKSIELASGILNIENKLELLDKRGYFLANNDQIHIEVESIGSWSQTFGVKVFLVVEY
ncbi:hypothetical protein SAMN05443633_11661 [Chryseobacterium arachidis]|uniref:Right handed beta helix region n=1 Tax=Chryseobacterium arachidis TaxID=1416778 RepID=A0A1M5K957_9FLAO|nr:hypothetical protein [Chryseobacterium arachidis]SHG49382.1 hypothetical protein SAMN05443633_11661 [Chryseobacterium arachidis]